MVSAAAKKKAVAKKIAADARHQQKARGSGPSQPAVKQDHTPEASEQLGHVRLPACLTPKQRALLHAVAEQHGFQHLSSGDGDARQLALGDTRKPAKEVHVDAAAISDEELCKILDEHLNIDARPHFAAAAAAPIVQQKSTATSTKGSINHDDWPDNLSVQDFISSTLPLLEMEKNAEVAQAQELMGGVTPETAQARGRALLQLKLRDAEGGLLGRTLLTFILNKGSGDTVSHPLPPHKFSPHDMVDIRPSKGDPGGPALVGGLVYRVREDCITVAVEEAPDEGLDQPLRLDKLANEAKSKQTGIWGGLRPASAPRQASWQDRSEQ